MSSLQTLDLGNNLLSGKRSGIPTSSLMLHALARSTQRKISMPGMWSGSGPLGRLVQLITVTFSIRYTLGYLMFVEAGMGTCITSTFAVRLRHPACATDVAFSRRRFKMTHDNRFLSIRCGCSVCYSVCSRCIYVCVLFAANILTSSPFSQGPVPPALEKLAALLILNLSGNQLSGEWNSSDSEYICANLPADGAPDASLLSLPRFCTYLHEYIMHRLHRTPFLFEELAGF